MEQAQLVAEDSIRDIAILRIDNPRSNLCVTLEPNILEIGTTCESLGFPLAVIDRTSFHLTLHFQGARISAFITSRHPSGRNLSFYETDALMYKGSSGCPGFLTNAHVYGLHNKSLTLDPTVQRQRRTRPTRRAPSQTERFAISAWIPSTDIIAFANENDIIF